MHIYSKAKKIILRQFFYIKRKYDFYINFKWKKNNIFEYREHMKSKKYKDSFYIMSNEFYGATYILKRYSKYDKKLQCIIEHGVGLDDTNNLGEIESKESNVLLTTSIIRKEILEKLTEKIVIPIAPLIFYAEPVYDNYNMKCIKTNLGKTLLVFPRHSVGDTQYVTNINLFINYVENIKTEKNYDTVLACCYFADIERGLHFRYQQRGWNIVTCGRIENFDFLDILKTLILLSDAIVTQGYTTAVAYAGCLGIPVNIYKDSCEAYGTGKDVNILYNYVYGQPFIDMYNLFAEFRESLTESQVQFVKKYFGVDCVWKPQELNLLFQFAEEIKKYRNVPKKLNKILSKDKYLEILPKIISTKWYVNNCV